MSTPAPTTITLTATISNQDGTPFDGELWLELAYTSQQDDTKIIIVPERKQTARFVNGVATMQVVPNAVMEQEGTFYRVQIVKVQRVSQYTQKVEQYLCKTVVVPNNDCNLADITAIEPVQPTTIEYVEQLVGEAKTAATSAQASATSAGTSASTATAQATTATNQAGIATTKAGEAATSATSASNSATSAQQSASTATAKVAEVATIGDQKIASITAEGTSQVSAVNTAGATQVSAVNSAGSTQVGNVNTAGTTQVGLVQAEGTTQKNAVQGEGTTQKNAVQAEGSTQVSAVQSVGTTQVGNVNTAGNTQVGLVNTAGATQISTIETTGGQYVAQAQTYATQAQTSATNAGTSASNALTYAQRSEAAYESFSDITATASTLQPSQSATASFNASTGVMSFGIPQGATGATGATGQAATIAVGTVSTGQAGSSASVVNSGTSSNAVFDFAIPRGDNGVYIGSSTPTDPEVRVWVATDGTQVETYSPTIVTDSSSTSVVLDAVANTHYTYGVLSSLTVSFPASTTGVYRYIHIMWESGATATTLTLSGTNALVPSYGVGANQICEIDAVWNAVKSKWIVKVAQQSNTNA